MVQDKGSTKTSVQTVTVNNHLSGKIANASAYFPRNIYLNSCKHKVNLGRGAFYFNLNTKILVYANFVGGARKDCEGRSFLFCIVHREERNSWKETRARKMTSR